MKDFEAKGAVILGISFDSVEANAKFAQKFSFPYKLLCDTDRKIGAVYGADAGSEYAKRVSYLIDPQGSIRHVWGKVDVKTHPDDVLKQIA